MTLRLGILGSTRGTVMQSIAWAIECGTLDASIELVVSNKPDAIILQRAAALAIPNRFIDPVGHDREQYDEKITAAFKSTKVDLILLIGYMRILSKSFVEVWHHKVINVHPSLLPKHGGLMDKAVHQSVLSAGDTQSGCTIHYVDENIDSGEIVLQKFCDIAPGETVDSLKEKVQGLERQAFVEAINIIGTTS